MQLPTKNFARTTPNVNQVPRRITSMLTGIALALTIVRVSAARKYGPPRQK
ncbi:MAG: hypothetical protein ACR2LX_04265 [Jatrophihabitans sp.]